jgi:hypothetical protein
MTIRLIRVLAAQDEGEQCSDAADQMEASHDREDLL